MSEEQAQLIIARACTPCIPDLSSDGEGILHTAADSASFFFSKSAAATLARSGAALRLAMYVVNSSNRIAGPPRASFSNSNFRFSSLTSRPATLWNFLNSNQSIVAVSVATWPETESGPSKEMRRSLSTFIVANILPG